MPSSLTDNTALDFDYVLDPEKTLESRSSVNAPEEQTVKSSNIIAPQYRSAKGLGTTSEKELNLNQSSVKLISRSIAELTSDDEYKCFLEQKRVYLRKKYTEGLSKKEELALQLTIWNIDRIEDAKYGKQLDALEAIVKAHEAAAAKISHTVDNFERLITSGQNPPGRERR
jgi:hypothetical protein